MQCDKDDQCPGNQFCELNLIHPEFGRCRNQVGRFPLGAPSHALSYVWPLHVDECATYMLLQ